MFNINLPTIKSMHFIQRSVPDDNLTHTLIEDLRPAMEEEMKPHFLVDERTNFHAKLKRVSQDIEEREAEMARLREELDELWTVKQAYQVGLVKLNGGSNENV